MREKIIEAMDKAFIEAMEKPCKDGHHPNAIEAALDAALKVMMEPDEAMLGAGCSGIYSQSFETAGDCWRAMLSTLTPGDER